MLTQTEIDTFFQNPTRRVWNEYEEMWADEKRQDNYVMERFERDEIKPSTLEEEEHKMKYFFNSEYNDYLIKYYPKEAMYRRFGSLAFCQYYHKGVLKKQCKRLKTRFEKNKI